MLRLPALLLVAALVLAGCPAPAEPMDDADFHDLLSQQAVGEPYSGAEKDGFFWVQRMWTLAVGADGAPAATSRYFYRTGEPIWRDEGWAALTAGVDSSMQARHWRPYHDGLTDEYVRAWAGGTQRVVIGRHRHGGDSTGYFVTAILTGAE